MIRPHPGITARVDVLNVVDGDTLDVEVKIRARVRLLDCWAPESRTLDLEEKQRGLAAKARLKELTTTGSGIVFIPTEQAHSIADTLTSDRILGRVWMDGQDRDLSSQQVAEGHASTMKGGAAGE